MLKYFYKNQILFQGFTQLEMVVTLAILGVFSALAGPQMFSVSKPLQNGTNQLAGILKQVRMRAIVTTTAYRVRPAADRRSLIVERATTSGCGAATTITANVADTATVLPVASVQGFFLDDELQVGTDGTNNRINGINPGTISLSAPLGTAQPAGSLIGLTNNWRSDASATGIAAEDLALPRPRNSFFGGFNDQQATEVQVVGPTDWAICFNSRGIAQRFNTTTGQPVAEDLAIPLQRFNTVSGTAIGQGSQVTVLQGGALTYRFGSQDLPDTTGISE
jgi:prepilin-type N-terminal cleavage/methylation domain-containing protein